MRRVPQCMLAVGLLLAGCPGPFSFDVDTTDDFGDTDPGDGQCAGANGLCSLRAAIEEANAHGVAQGIVIRLLSSGTYAIDSDVNGARGLIIDGPPKIIEILGCCSDPSLTTIEPTFLSRIFTIEGGVTTLRRVRLTGGHAPDGPLSPGEVQDGGAIHVSGAGAQLRLDRVILEGNVAERQGGAVWFANDPFTFLEIESSEIRDNSAAIAGVGGAGGVDTGASTFVTDTLFELNEGHSGGLHLHEDDGTAQADSEIRRSTFRDNTSGSSGGGGGLRVDIDGSRVVVTESTFSENDTVGPSGAGIAAQSGTVELSHVTITRNQADSNGHGMVVASGASVTIRASIIAQNPAFTVGGDDQIACGTLAELTFDSFNLVDGVSDACDFTAESTDDLGPVDAGLLGYVELPIGHHPLAADSVAIDHAEFFCGGTDQIGNSRPVDGDGDTIARCDAGAIEYQGP